MCEVRLLPSYQLSSGKKAQALVLYGQRVAYYANTMSYVKKASYVWMNRNAHPHLSGRHVR